MKAQRLPSLALITALALMPVSRAAAQTFSFSDANWLSLGTGITGMSNAVVALAVSGNTLYASAGGDFGVASSGAPNYIARWNGTGWSAVGSTTNTVSGSGCPSCNTAVALAALGDTLYAGGAFTSVGGVPANAIAKWDGNQWSALGPGFSGGSVSALAVSGTNLYAGVGSLYPGTSNYVAKWNGSSWPALGSGMSGPVSALAVSGTDLYAGGGFTVAGGVAANLVAKWDGNSWSALGSGLSGGGGIGPPNVVALAVSGTNLYAGGHFTSAGGVPANYIAKWDGTSWSALGSGLNYSVFALAISGTNLYAGGEFTVAGGVAANYIARWDGSSWSALGSGMGGSGFAGQVFVTALAASDNFLYAGGLFTTAGGKSSAYVAEAVLVWPGITGGPFRNPDGSMTLNLLTDPSSSSRLYSSANLAPPIVWHPIYTNLSGGRWQFTDTNTTGFQNKFYRSSTP
jgi:hypothetical protein